MSQKVRKWSILIPICCWVLFKIDLKIAEYKDYANGSSPVLEGSLTYHSLPNPSHEATCIPLELIWEALREILKVVNLNLH